MTRSNSEIQLPRGVGDFLPETTGKIAFIEKEIKRVFELWGFQRVIPPKLEYEDVLTIGMGEGLRGKTYRFDDRQTGRLLAFPPDITPQIARIVSTRLKSLPLPHRISYSGRVLRQTVAGSGQSREIFQSGVELIGLDSPEADAELIVMAIEIMRNLGFDNFKIDLGQVEFCRGVIESASLPPIALTALEKALKLKDSSAVAKIVAEFVTDPAAAQELNALTRLFGGIDVIQTASEIANNSRSKAALQNISDVVEILKMHKVCDYLTIDLGETRGLDYHTGLTFEGFVAGVGEAVCTGGRYDHLASKYGFDTYATGLTFNVLALLNAMHDSESLQETKCRDILLFNATDNKAIALDVARTLRGQGFTVARDIIKRDLEDSLQYAKSTNFRLMLVLDDTAGNTEYRFFDIHSARMKISDLEEIKSFDIKNLFE